MLTKQVVIEVLGREARRLRAAGRLHSLALFGSVARDQAGAGSDVDILIELAAGEGLFGLCDIADQLEQALHVKVDLVPADSIRPALKERILAEAIPL